MDAALPAEHDGRHVLALPAGLPPGRDVEALARAWFPGAAWEQEPVAAVAASSRPMTGARFRGLVVQDEVPAQPGRLRLTDDAALAGPHPLDEQTARDGLRVPGPLDLFALDGEASSQVRAWFVAAARRAGGLVVPAQRAQVMAPEPGSVVALTLWSAVPLTLVDVLPLVRPAMVGARVTPSPGPDAPGPQTYAVTAAFDYDGDVTLRTSRSTEVPVVLSTLSWRDYGPWAYRITWTAPDEQEGSALADIARQRVAPTVARVAAALHAAAGGTVVDAGGFVVGPQELAERAVQHR